MGFYTYMEKRASNYYSTHLPEADRLRLFEAEKKRMSTRGRRSGSWIPGAAIGGGLGAVLGLGHRGVAPVIVGGLAGAAAGGLIGSASDSIYNDNTAEAARIMKMSPKDRRLAYISRFADHRDDIDAERDARDERRTRAMERRAYGDDDWPRRRPVFIGRYR